METAVVDVFSKDFLIACVWTALFMAVTAVANVIAIEGVRWLVPAWHREVGVKLPQAARLPLAGLCFALAAGAGFVGWPNPWLTTPWKGQVMPSVLVVVMTGFGSLIFNEKIFKQLMNKWYERFPETAPQKVRTKRAISREETKAAGLTTGQHEALNAETEEEPPAA